MICPQAIQVNPKDPELYFNRGISAFILQKDGVTDMERSLQLNPKNDRALNNRQVGALATQLRQDNSILQSQITKPQPAAPATPATPAPTVDPSVGQQILAGIQPLLQLRMGNVAGDDDRPCQRELRHHR